MNNLGQEILKLTEHSICDNESTYRIFLERLKGGNLTRDENGESHFCVYFLPYNLQNKKVFMVHHKKSGLWLSPGGHIDKGEDLLGALNREIEEELGIKGFKPQSPAKRETQIRDNPTAVPLSGTGFKNSHGRIRISRVPRSGTSERCSHAIKNHFEEAPSPFLLTITPVNNQVQPCKTHYDIWYLLITDGNNFSINPQEFHDTKWLIIEEARRVVIDPANIKALEVVENTIL